MPLDKSCSASTFCPKVSLAYFLFPVIVHSTHMEVLRWVFQKKAFNVQGWGCLFRGGAFACQNRVYLHKLFKIKRCSFRGGVQSNRFHYAHKGSSLYVGCTSLVFSLSPKNQYLLLMILKYSSCEVWFRDHLIIFLKLHEGPSITVNTWLFLPDHAATNYKN